MKEKHSKNKQTKFLTRNWDKMFAIIGEFESGDQFRMTKHGGHAFARMEIVNGQSFVCTGSRQIDSRSIQYHFDQGSIFAIGALEGLDVFPIPHRVHTNIAILTGRQNVLMIVL